MPPSIGTRSITNRPTELVKIA